MTEIGSIEELCDYIQENADKIYVREQRSISYNNSLDSFCERCIRK